MRSAKRSAPIFCVNGRKAMIENYKPTWMLKAVYLLTSEQIKKNGIKAVLVDLDNTLIAWNNPDGTPELRDWLDKMKESNIPVIVVSNNKKSRVERAVAPFDLPFVWRAMKPFRHGFKQVEKEFGYNRNELVMVGDQLMTDIRGANRAGIRSILVQPIIETDAWNTRINRWRERRVMKKLREKYPMEWRTTID